MYVLANNLCMTVNRTGTDPKYCSISISCAALGIDYVNYIYCSSLDRNSDSELRSKLYPFSSFSGHYGSTIFPRWHVTGQCGCRRLASLLASVYFQRMDVSVLTDRQASNQWAAYPWIPCAQSRYADHTLSGIILTYWLGINDITISPDSLYIATASDDHTSDIHLLHPPPGVTFFPPPLEPSDASDTEDRPVAPVPPQSAVSSSSSTVPAIRHLVSHTAPVLSVAFSPKSNLLATGSFDESTIIWDVRRGKVLRQLPAHADAVWCVAWDAEGEMVLTAGADGLM